MKKLILSSLSLAIFAMIGCVADVAEVDAPISTPNLPETPFDYRSSEDIQSAITNFNLADNNPSDNSLTDAGATLGRVLFYDKKLSLNNTVSCGSCHHQDKGFADGRKFSPGFEGAMTTRNSMAISNLRYQTQFFWTSNPSPLEEQVLAPVQNHLEMGMENPDDLAIKLAKYDYYPELFEAAFGTQEVSADRVGKALAQFIRSMVSYRTKFDAGKDNDHANLTAMELLGWELYQTKACIDCHNREVDLAGYYTMPSANIGLDLDYADEGIGNGVFKIPTLRNVALTGPYMHDGRFETLEEVVEHYNSGVKDHPSLNWSLQENGQPKQLNLSVQEKQALVAFLHSLTDHELINDPKFSDPFLD